MIPPYLSVQSLDAAILEAEEHGLIESGLARRAQIVVRLAETLPPSQGLGTRSDPVSGQSLADEMGSSRAAVHKHMEQLRTSGFEIESVSGAGYRLGSPFHDLLAGEAVLPFLVSLSQPALPDVGLPYVYQQSCESTNGSLRKMVSAGEPLPGTTVVADHQTRGRGRLDRVWRDQPGRDLSFSVLLRPSLAPGRAHLLSLAAALAVAEAIEEHVGSPAPLGIKWPNDVVAGERKLCGILLEGSMDFDRLQWAIAGIGLNVNSDCSAVAAVIEQEDKGGLAGRPVPVSLKELIGEVPRAPLLAAVLGRLGVRWRELEDPSGTADILAGLRERDALVGRPLEVFGVGADGGTIVAGEGAGFGPEGQLLVRTASGEVAAIFAGDVTLRSGSRSEA